MRGLLLHGYGFLLSMRAEDAEALTVAQRAGARASASDDPVLMMTACSVQGHVHLMQGRPRAGREWIERALPSIDGQFLATTRANVSDLWSDSPFCLERLAWRSGQAWRPRYLQAK